MFWLPINDSKHDDLSSFGNTRHYDHYPNNSSLTNMEERHAKTTFQDSEPLKGFTTIVKQLQKKRNCFYAGLVSWGLFSFINSCKQTSSWIRIDKTHNNKLYFFRNYTFKCPIRFAKKAHRETITHLQFYGYKFIFKTVYGSGYILILLSIGNILASLIEMCQIVAHAHCEVTPYIGRHFVHSKTNC